MEDFITRATYAHGNTYDYSNVKYINDSKKIMINFLIHGMFEQITRVHCSGHGCIKCARNKISIIKTSNNLEFIKKAIINHGDKYDYSKIKYIKAIKNVVITCKIHGDFNQTPNSHLYGKGCPKCGGSAKLNNE